MSRMKAIRTTRETKQDGKTNHRIKRNQVFEPNLDGVAPPKEATEVMMTRGRARMCAPSEFITPRVASRDRRSLLSSAIPLFY